MLRRTIAGLCLVAGLGTACSPAPLASLPTTTSTVTTTVTATPAATTVVRPTTAPARTVRVTTTVRVPTTIARAVAAPARTVTVARTTTRAAAPVTVTRTVVRTVATTLPAPAESSTAIQQFADTGTVSYTNCSAVRAAGKAPLYRGDPGYSSKLDRDGDGIACE